MKKQSVGIWLWLAFAAPVSAATYTPKDGPELVAAVKAAVPCDVITLTPGTVYVVQELVFPVKPAGACPITLRSSATLPERRITPADAPLLPIVTSGHLGTPLNIGAGVVGWRIDGIQLTGNGMYYIQIRGAESITLDRILIQAPGGTTHRAIEGNGKSITLTRSHIDNVWLSTLADTQAFCAWNGAGPYVIRDNYLEAAGENLMFGGANSSSAANIPSDILVEGNLITKRLEWKGKPRGVKNLFEIKSGRRAIIRNNVFENNWTDAQNGYSILITGRNDEGQSPWSVAEDVLFERNIVRNVENGINVLGYDTYQASGRTQRLTFRGNLVQTTGTFMQIGSEVGSLTVDHNTVDNGGTFMLMYKGAVWVAPATALRDAQFAVEGFVVTGNIGRHNDYGVIAEGAGIGAPGLAGLTKGGVYTWTDNVLARTEGPYPNYPPTTYWPTVEALKAAWAPLTYELPATNEFAVKKLGWAGMTGIIPPIDPPIDPPKPVDPLIAMRADLDAEKAKSAALEANLNKLLTYLTGTPNTSKIQQLIAYLKGVPK